jgi:phytoene/squalene synthetase
MSMPKDLGRMAADGLGVVGQLDAAGLAPAAHLHLRLHHHRVAGGVGLGHGFVHRVGHAPRRYRDAEAGEVLLALVLVEIHRLLPL